MLRDSINSNNVLGLIYFRNGYIMKQNNIGYCILLQHVQCNRQRNELQNCCKLHSTKYYK